MPGFHEVRALTANDAGRILREDGNLVGLISVRKDGVSVSFFYRYRWGDQNKEHSCGSWPRKSLMDIRKARNQARTLIDEQINPNGHKKIAKAHLGVSLDVIDRCQNHILAGSRVRRHYLHHDDVEEKKRAWHLLGDRLSAVLSSTYEHSPTESMMSFPAYTTDRRKFTLPLRD